MKSKLLLSLLLTSCILSAEERKSTDTKQPSLTSQDLAQFLGISYIKASIDSKSTDRPSKVRLLLQTPKSKPTALIEEIEIPYHPTWRQSSIDFIFLDQKQGVKRNLYLGCSYVGMASFRHTVSLNDFEKAKTVCIHYLPDYSFAKGRYIIMTWDADEKGRDLKYDDGFIARLILEVE
jgi:hypothetical protein